MSMSMFCICWSFHDDVIKWKPFHRWPVNSQHKGQWRGALMFSFICNWTYGWVSNRYAGDLRRHRAHYEVIVMRTGNISNVFDITVWVIETLTEHCANNQFIWNSHVSGLRYKYLILDFWISKTHSKKALLWRKCAFFSCCQLVCHILRLQIDFTCRLQSWRDICFWSWWLRPQAPLTPNNWSALYRGLGVYGQPLQHGEVRDTNLAWVGPVTPTVVRASNAVSARLHECTSGGCFT